MSFINVNKVTLDSSEDLKEIINNVTLLFASIVYDFVQEKKYKDALSQIELLKYSISQLEYVLQKHIDKEEENKCIGRPQVIEDKSNSITFNDGMDD